MPNFYPNLNPEKALIWRIVHRDNLGWILDNGLQCGNSSVRSENWIHIGNQELIDKRATHPLPPPYTGYLNDYVPFYFTPFSVMMHNIHTGWGGIRKRHNEELLILVSSIHHVHSIGARCVFTDGHAYFEWTNFFSEVSDLAKIDWRILQTRDFKRDPDDPARFERYQAEALVHNHLPVNGLLGIVCYTETLRERIQQEVVKRQLPLKVYTRKNWYFE